MNMLYLSLRKRNYFKVKALDYLEVKNHISIILFGKYFTLDKAQQIYKTLTSSYLHGIRQLLHCILFSTTLI